MLQKRLYIIFSEPSETGADRQAVFPDHIAYIKGLKRDSLLFAAGPFIDDISGEPQGPGMIVIRADSAAGAAAIAERDPFHAGGYRTFRVQPWLVNEGGFNPRVNFSDGRYSFD